MLEEKGKWAENKWNKKKRSKGKRPRTSMRGKKIQYDVKGVVLRKNTTGRHANIQMKQESWTERQGQDQFQLVHNASTYSFTGIPRL